MDVLMFYCSLSVRHHPAQFKHFNRLQGKVTHGSFYHRYFPCLYSVVTYTVYLRLLGIGRKLVWSYFTGVYKSAVLLAYGELQKGFAGKWGLDSASMCGTESNTTSGQKGY